jgi:hypothetical protein
MNDLKKTNTMITEEVKDKLAKVYALVNSGGTEGEKQAAKLALDRLMKKYNLDESILNSLDLKTYIFKYATTLEYWLIKRIMFMMVPHAIKASARGAKRIESNLKYIDWVTIECAYEYFRRHMKKEWQRVVSPELNKTRKAKTRKKRRDKLDQLFFSDYVILSGLTKPEELETVDVSSMSEREREDRFRLAGIKGGSYNRQLSSGLLLEN